jgi:hypothetical protein
MTATARDSAVEVPTSEQLVSRIKELQPLLAANSAQGEQDRRVVGESIVALTKAGIFKVAQPRRYGGYEVYGKALLGREDRITPLI